MNGEPIAKARQPAGQLGPQAGKSDSRRVESGPSRLPTAGKRGSRQAARGCGWSTERFFFSRILPANSQRELLLHPLTGCLSGPALDCIDATNVCTTLLNLTHAMTLADSFEDRLSYRFLNSVTLSFLQVIQYLATA